ncbi:N-acetyltransferase [Mucilaginibacter sp. SP1R1]|uniref:N-acetyltransferase n=1 Tax=Mucilaginibacter sp. SP1R1 TaxID=2723091 RepID=UPI0016157E50|nr:N-acetyltransferase [Mucilaginibacter sp. SP1R1]MBB6149453.1 GNAT superfamily N-acetyltransferase [Mucilaginibacter sp. SP1R1]
MTLEECTLRPYNSEALNFCSPFDCGHKDLNDFFANDSIDYSNQLLGKTYCFTANEDPKLVVAAFTVANDSIKTTHLPNARKQKVNKLIPNVKRMRSYPAVLIGRLGVNSEFSRNGLGSEVMDFIKAWFIHDQNKTGCRYIVVDAYNEKRPLDYYIKNGFIYLFNDENQEREFLLIPDEAPLKSRLMFFDLIVLRN